MPTRLSKLILILLAVLALAGGNHLITADVGPATAQAGENDGENSSDDDDGSDDEGDDSDDGDDPIDCSIPDNQDDTGCDTGDVDDDRPQSQPTAPAPPVTSAGTDTDTGPFPRGGIQTGAGGTAR